MLNYIWCTFITLSVIFGLVTGNINEVNNSIFESISDTVSLIIKLFGNMCFWSGIINIISNTKLNSFIRNMIDPIYRKLFKNIDENSKAYEYITINGISNILGLSNAATPSGIKAINELNNMNNKEELSDDMLMFIAINTASIQLLPTTIIGIRNSYGSKNSSDIILAVWFSSLITFISIIVIVKAYTFFRRIK